MIRHAETARRLTVAEAILAYEAAGVGKTTGEFVSKCRLLACPLGALYIASVPGASQAFDLDDAARQWAWSEFGYDYCEGFWFGFDGEEAIATNSERWHEGYDDGVKVKRALEN